MKKMKSKGSVKRMLTATNSIEKMTIKTNEEMEHAFSHIMDQFRQINSKYGLMVGEEIKELYDQKIELIHFSKGYIERIEERTKKM